MSTTQLKQFTQHNPRVLPAIVVTSYFSVYFFVSMFNQSRPPALPAIAIDHMIPLQPEWVFVYAFVYIFAFIPVFVVRDPDLFWNTVKAYAAMFTLSYLAFLFYPTAINRPATHLPIHQFSGWGLGVVWTLDPPRNCFPSLHVAGAFLASWATYKVHRGIGLLCFFIASMISISTLYTKQHYFVDLISGFAAAAFVSWLYLIRVPTDHIPQDDISRAPARAGAVVLLYAAFVFCFYIAFKLDLPIISIQQP